MGKSRFSNGRAGFFFGRSGMGSLESLPYFCSLNTIPVVEILNFDFGALSHPPSITYKKDQHHFISRVIEDCYLLQKLLMSKYFELAKNSSVEGSTASSWPFCSCNSAISCTCSSPCVQKSKIGIGLRHVYIVELSGNII